MIRVLIFIILLFFAALGFAWLADLPGTVSIGWEGYVWEQSPIVAVVMLGFVLVAVLALHSLVMTILRSPRIANRFFVRRRREKGYRALSRGLLALGAGDAKLARKHGVDADKLLKHEPATKLLLAQTAQMAGRHDEARERYEAMLEEDDTRPVGLHGLFIEAEREGEPLAARHYAEEAAREAPGLAWAGQAVLGYQAVARDWEKALHTLEANYTAKLLDKKTYRRHRAVILTALAMDLEQGEPDRAYSLAREAHGMALDLVPAAVLAARLATRKGEIRKATKLIESTWRVAPHPDLAEAYAHVRTGDSAVDRLKRVKVLAGQKANAAEGSLAVARVAIEAREFDEARDALKSVLRAETSRAAFLLMAELEEAEHGDKGRMREWLARAVRAPQDKAWVADGIVSRDWRPVSPVTGRLDAFEWTTPAGMDEGAVLLEDAAFDEPGLPVLTPAQAEATEAAAVVSSPAGAQADRAAADEASMVDVTPRRDISPAARADAATPAPSSAKPQATPAVEVLPGKEGYEGTTDDVSHMTRPQDLAEAPATGTPAAAAATTPADTKASTPAPQAAAGDVRDKPAAAAPSPAKPAQADPKQPIAFPLERMPDDPGLEDEEGGEAFATPTRPRFFN